MATVVEHVLSLLPNSWEAWHAAVQESTWGGVDGKSCVAGTPNQYQRQWEPDHWGCKNGTTAASGLWYIEGTQSWMARHYEVPVLLSLAYLIVIFGLQAIMRNFQPFSLRPVLVLWNFLLASFSLLGSYYTVPAIVSFANGPAAGDWKVDTCTVITEAANPWVFFFIVSKIPELLDTVFLALRKRPIMFLHWYHHIATMLYCWDAWSLLVPAGGPFAAMNLVVHTIMYTYYCVMALHIRVPSFLASVITALQTIQMLGGIYILTTALQTCPTSQFSSDSRVRLNYYLGLLMYASYAFLFLKFFVDRYFIGRRRSQPAISNIKKTA
ncbi:MAG: elongation of very long chain fatty acids protein [archaeon]|nr:elongation of very long chain fatty acids protein [archaeon]